MENREHAPGPQPVEVKPSAVELSTAARLPVDVSGENVLSKDIISHSLETTLEQMGIDPDNVMLAGYLPGGTKMTYEEVYGVDDIPHDPEQLIAEREACQRRLDILRQDRDPDLEDDLSDEMYSLVNRLAVIEATLHKPGGAIFCFTPFEALRRAGGHRSAHNPINYAGPDGVIGVYDQQALVALDPEKVPMPNGTRVVRATLDEIESAKIMTYKPRYVPDE